MAYPRNRHVFKALNIPFQMKLSIYFTMPILQITFVLLFSYDEKLWDNFPSIIRRIFCSLFLKIYLNNAVKDSLKDQV